MEPDDQHVSMIADHAIRSTTSEDFLSPRLASDISKAADLVIRQSEHNPDWTWVRALIAAIPYIGGSLDLLIASRGQQLAQERILHLFSSLTEEMRRVDQNSVRKEFLETEEWYDLVVRAVGAAARTRHRTKIRYYARILLGAATVPDGSGSSPEEYVAVLAELTPREIEVARAIYNQQRADTRKDYEVISDLTWAKAMGWDHLLEDCPSVPAEDLPFVLSRLQSTGLIHEITGTYFDYAGGVYVITHTFRRLVDFLGSLDDE